MPVDEEFTLDTSRAEAAIDGLERRLAEALRNAGQQGGDDLAAALAGVEVAPTIDTATISADVSSAVAEAPAVVEPTLDAEQLVVPDLPGEVTAEVANPEEITTTIEGAIADVDKTVTVEVDTTQAAANTDELGESLGDLGAKGKQAESGLSSAGSAATVFSGVVGAAQGKTAGLAGTVAALGPEAAVVGGSIAALTGFIDASVGAALDAQTQTERLTRSLGEQAEKLQTIDVEGFSQDLTTLAVSLGSDDDAIKGTVASLANLGTQSGATRSEVEATGEQLVALAARAVALNPQLGSVQDVLASLPNALARGGRSAAQFGIDITAADVALEAAKRGLGDVSELSTYERAALSADIVTKRLGTSLGSDITSGSQQAVFQFRSIRQEISETIEGVGAPLVEPVLHLLQSVAPIAEGLAKVIGSVGEAVVGVLGPILEEVGPELGKEFADIGETVQTIAPALEDVAVLVADVLPPAIKVADVLFRWTTPLGLAVTLIDKLGLANETVAANFRSADDAAAALGIQTQRDGEFITDYLHRIEDAEHATGENSAAIGLMTDDLAGFGEVTQSTSGAVRDGTEALDDFTAAAAAGGTAFGDGQMFSDLASGVEEFNATLLDSRGLTDDAFFALLQVGNRGPGLIDKLTDALARGSLSTAEFQQTAADYGLTLEQLGAVERKVRADSDALAQETADFGKAVSDSLGTITTAAANVDEDASQHIGSFIKSLQQQALDAAGFANSIATLIARGATELAQAFIDAGPKAAGAAAEAATASDEQLATLEGNTAQVNTLFTESADTIVRETNRAKTDGIDKLSFEGLVPAGIDLNGEITSQLGVALAPFTGVPAHIAEVGTETGTQFVVGMATGVAGSSGSLYTAIANVILGAESAAVTAAEIKSPSRLFAREVGEPISEGIAKGILDAQGDVHDAVGDLMDQIETDAVDRLSAITTAAGAALDFADAQNRLADAKATLADLQTEQAGLPAVVAKATADVARLQVESQAITAREQQAIDRAAAQVADIRAAINGQGPAAAAAAAARAALIEAQQGQQLGTVDQKAVDDALEQFDKARIKANEERAKFTRNDLVVAEQDLADARSDAVAPTRELEDAQRTLNEAQERQTAIGRDLRDAQADVARSTLGVLTAQQDLNQAGRDYIDNVGPNQILLFTELGLQAGLNKGQISALATGYGNLAAAAENAAARVRASNPISVSLSQFGADLPVEIVPGVVVPASQAEAVRAYLVAVDKASQTKSKGPSIGVLNVNQVANDPAATAYHTAAVLGSLANR